MLSPRAVCSIECNTLQNNLLLITVLNLVITLNLQLWHYLRYKCTSVSPWWADGKGKKMSNVDFSTCSQLIAVHLQGWWKCGVVYSFWGVGIWALRRKQTANGGVKCKLHLRQKQLDYTANMALALCMHLQRWHANTKLAKRPDWVYADLSPAARPWSLTGNKGSDGESGLEHCSHHLYLYRLLQ